MQIIQQVSKDLKISKLLLNFNQYSISTFRATLKKSQDSCQRIHKHGSLRGNPITATKAWLNFLNKMKIL